MSGGEFCKWAENRLTQFIEHIVIAISPYTQMNTYPLYGDERCPSEGVARIYAKTPLQP